MAVVLYGMVLEKKRRKGDQTEVEEIGGEKQVLYA
jgi:hypothetical protein